MVVGRPCHPLCRAFRGLATLCVGNANRSPDVSLRSAARMSAPRRGGGRNSRGIVGVLAIVAKRERSFLIMLSILVGAVDLLWTIGSLLGLNQ